MEKGSFPHKPPVLTSFSGRLKIKKFSIQAINPFKNAQSFNSRALALAPNFSTMDAKTRKKSIKYSLILGNITLLVIVSSFILINRSASQTVRSSTVSSLNSVASDITNPLDQLSSSQIALAAAQSANMKELTSLRNQVDSDSLTLNIIPNDNVAVSKPQIVATAKKSKQDIRQYVAVAGDTVASLATKFGVTEESIKWSNSITGNNISVGAKLAVPPVNGIVYTVKAGDTPASLATRYQADTSQIIAYNDAEISGLKPGEQVIIPNGRILAPVVARTYTNATSFISASFAPNYGYNGYDFGYCTYYVANRVAVPANWGNANTWDDYAAISGWTVSSTPVVGAILQSDKGAQGHVGVVDALSPDGTMMKYSDMNSLAGWGRVGYSDWVPITKFSRYIYR